MLLTGDHIFYDEDALLERLTEGAKEAGRDVVFLVGAPLSAPEKAGDKGVADVESVIELIGNQFNDPGAKLKFNQHIADTENRYQTAFQYLIGVRGQDAANNIIKKAVWGARADSDSDDHPPSSRTSDERCKRYEDEIGKWSIPAGTKSLGRLVSQYPDVFGSCILTSNFDPLIHVSIKSANGTCYRTILHRDGNINQTNGAGTHVVHLHGYWYGSDTLHIQRQLLQNRPRLKASLTTLLKQKTLVVLGYSGWDDIFMEALSETVSDDAASPEIIWTFYSNTPSPSDKLLSRLEPAMDRGRVSFYRGIDCNKFLPRLATRWQEMFPRPNIGTNPAADNPRSESATELRQPLPSSNFVGGRPPIIEAWVGREDELQKMKSSSAEIIAISGMGGQGKSALAAQFLKYFKDEYDFVDWRDCREEGDRILTHIVSLVEAITDSEIKASHIINQASCDITEVFSSAINRRKCLIVLDNVDRYVDLERGLFTDVMNDIVNSVRAQRSDSRIIITCRPDINYISNSVLSIHLQGISESEAQELFQKRNALNATSDDIRKAHELTEGHPFWLDLIAVQVSRSEATSLPRVIADIRRGHADLPNLLTSIWEGLAERERTVLRTMAEAVRPETQEDIGRYVSSFLSYNKFMKAMNSLRRIGLIVIKPQDNSPDLLELHPIVRQFVRQNFPKNERADYIRKIVDSYISHLNHYRKMLEAFLPFSILGMWSQKVELEIEAGLYPEAFKTLAEAKSALIAGGYSEEYVRVAKRLLESVNWNAAAVDIREFDDIVTELIESTERLSRKEEVDSLLKAYEQTIPIKNARFINYCNTQCYCLWFRGDYAKAIEWGERGAELKRKSNVDTKYDCEHNLALARRDSGDVESALTYFIKGKTLEGILDQNNFEIGYGGHFYGNVGRCLYFLGRPDDALLCLRKSARILEECDAADNIINRAYAREWIADALVDISEFAGAWAIYNLALLQWKKTSPSKAEIVRRKISSLELNGHSFNISECQMESIYNSWVRKTRALAIYS